MACYEGLIKMTKNEEFDVLFAEISEEISESLGKYNIPGLSISVVDNDGPVWSKGFGHTDTTKEKSVDTDTMFMIGSLSKAYTVTAFLRAVQKGMVKLDDPIINYYPEFSWNTRFGEEEREKLTFRHLLTHWGGFQHNVDLFNEDGSYCDFEEYMERIKDSWQKYPVETRFSYSNVGFDLASYILGKIAGMSFAEFMRQEVYEPLGMTRSFVLAEEALLDENCATGHIKDTPTSRELTLFPELGAGSQFSCVSDMSKFLQMHFNAGKVDGEQFLSTELLNEMYTIPFAVDHQMTGTGMGIGVLKFRFGGTLALSFFGDGPGYVGLHQIYPELGIGWLIQANQVAESFPAIINVLKKIRDPLIEWKMGSVPEDLTLEGKTDLPSEIDLETSYLNRLAGKYISRMLDVDLVAHSKTTFSGKNIPLMEFQLDTNGRPLTVSFFDDNGQITVLDYDRGRLDLPGPNLEEWKSYSGIYSYDYGGFRLYSTPVVKNGHLYLISSMNNKEYLLTTSKTGVFFTADGQNVVFKKGMFLMPSSTWKLDDITVEKIQELHRKDVDDIRLQELSLSEYIQILEQIGENDGSEEIKKIKDERYPKEKQ